MDAGINLDGGNGTGGDLCLLKAEALSQCSTEGGNTV